MPISPRAIVLALAAAAATGTTACSAGNPEACTVVCGDLGQCPDGTSCGVDGYCYAGDESPGSCSSETPDGSPGQPDGPLSGDPDAAVVVDPDAAIERPDASIGDDACAGEETFGEADPGPYLIPDGDPAGITLFIDVRGMCAAVQSVEISIDVTHAFRGDIGADLTSPSGETVVLIEPSDDSLDDIHEVFQVDIASGEDANGEWLLNIFDQVGVDQGTLDRWSIGINQSAP